MLKRTLCVCCAFVSLAAGPATLHYPPAPSDRTTDTYHGTTVSDPYRPLENSDDPAVKGWAAAETKLATDYIQSQASYAFYAKRVAEQNRAFAGNGRLQIAGGRFFYWHWAAGAQQPALVVRDRIDGPERTLFDPRNAVRAGEEPSIDSMFVAPNGSKVALTTQYGGTEDETLQVIDATTGAESDTMPQGNGGLSPTAVLWDADGEGFIHTTWPKNADGTFAKSGIFLVHHVLGTNASADTYVFGKGLSPQAEYDMTLSSADGTVQALFESDGDGVPASIYMRRGRRKFVRVAAPSAGITMNGTAGVPAFAAAFVGRRLYVASKKRSSFGEILAIAPDRSIATARVVVPPSNVVIRDIIPVPGGFITDDIDGGDGAARLFAPDGTLRARIPIPPVSTSLVIADPNSRADSAPIPKLFDAANQSRIRSRNKYD